MSAVLKICGSSKLVRVDKAAPRSQFRALHEIADRLRPKVRRHFLAALKSIKDEAKITELALAAQTGNVERVMQVLALNTMARRAALMTEDLQNAFDAAAKASVLQLPKALQLQASFDLLNPRSVAFLRQYKLDLITQLTGSTREGIRELLISSFEEGIPPRAIARRIKEQIGLTRRQVVAVRNFRQMLLSEGRKPAQVDRMVNKYARRQLRYRSENIARTETIRAANAGQNELWRQMRQDNLLPADVKRKWIVTPDDRLCPICRPIPGMNEGGVPLGAAFETPSGMKSMPPAHPQCRCAVALDI